MCGILHSEYLSVCQLIVRRTTGYINRSISRPIAESNLFFAFIGRPNVHHVVSGIAIDHCPGFYGIGESILSVQHLNSYNTAFAQCFILTIICKQVRCKTSKC